VEKWFELLNKEDFKAVVLRLLDSHYDKLYNYSQKKRLLISKPIRIEAENLELKTIDSISKMLIAMDNSLE